jgi:hypothetical protein
VPKYIFKIFTYVYLMYKLEWMWMMVWGETL